MRETNKLLSFASRVDFSNPERNEEAIYAMNFCIVQIKEMSPSFRMIFGKTSWELD